METNKETLDLILQMKEALEFAGFDYCNKKQTINAEDAVFKALDAATVFIQQNKGKAALATERQKP